MPAWEFEADASGVVVTGRTARVQGTVTEAGKPVSGYEAHTFSFDIVQLQAAMYDEDMSAEEALEAALVKQIRDLQRTVQPVAPDVPAPPTAISGFAGRKLASDLKAHRERPQRSPA